MQTESSGEPPKAKPPRGLQDRARFLAEDSVNVIITDHAEQRMYERGITAKMLFSVLRTGHLEGTPRPGRQAGDWVLKLTKRLVGRRDVGVVVAVILAGKLVVVTVEWEDLK